jgi:hypothetical protein
LFTLLNPAALLALTGLLVPVAIHLWNRRPGREVAVGSLRWLAAGANRRLRNLKLEQFGVLLLRAALLAVLAMTVARPAWQQPVPASRGVVLLSPEVLRLPTLATLRPAIDSLRRRGYALRWLARDFQRVSGSQWRAGTVDDRGVTPDSAARSEAPEFTWARVQQATATFPGQPLVVVTSAALRQFQEPRPLLPATVTWQTVPDTASKVWLQAANVRGRQADTLQLLVGRSDEASARFHYQRIPYQAQAGGQIRLEGLGAFRLQSGLKGREKLALIPAENAAGKGPAIAVASEPLPIRIYSTPAYAAEARTLLAGLRAAALGLPIMPQIRTMAAPPAAGSPGWLFWLSDEPLPPAWREAVAQGAQVWQEAAGSGIADTAQLATALVESAVFRREAKLPAEFSAGQPIWTDSYGRPVLMRLRIGTGTIYHLSTRLHPAWSQLADSPELPAQLLQLVQPALFDTHLLLPTDLDRQLARYDQRALDPAQLTTATRAQPPAVSSPSPNQRTTDLRPWLVLIAGLLLLFERLLARRRENRTLTSVAP